MKIAVVNTSAPFVRGGAELLSEALVVKLREFGHQAELVKIPYAWDDVASVVTGMVAASTYRIRNVDRTIVHKFPSYYVRHENKVGWLFHQFRQVYDLWETPYGMGRAPGDAALRAIVTRCDTQVLGQFALYTNSQVTRDRLERFNGLKAQVLYPPLPDERGFRCDDYGDYMFCPSRVNAMKRQELLIRALGMTRSAVRLHLAGIVEDPGELARLRSLAESLGVAKRLVVEDGFMSELRKRELFAGALACAYVPVDEDSYGFVPLEAFASEKAVVSTVDAGGVLQVVRDGLSGLVVDATAEALATAMDRLFEDRVLAERLGRSGREVLQGLGISWERVVETLTR